MQISTVRLELYTFPHPQVLNYNLAARCQPETTDVVDLPPITNYKTEGLLACHSLFKENINTNINSNSEHVSITWWMPPTNFGNFPHVRKLHDFGHNILLTVEFLL